MKDADTHFDEATHTYTIDRKPVPSVTQVLSDLLPSWQASEWHLQRGQAVHACAAMIALGQDFDFDPQIEGQVIACRKFFAEMNPAVIDVEKELYSEQYRYAGTMDMLCRLGRYTVVLDWKASFSASLPYQLGGYAIIANVSHGVGVQLLEDGTYRMSEIYGLRRYKTGFLALLSAYNIRKECGVNNERKETNE